MRLVCSLELRPSPTMLTLRAFCRLETAAATFEALRKEENFDLSLLGQSISLEADPETD